MCGFLLFWDFLESILEEPGGEDARNLVEGCGFPIRSCCEVGEDGDDNGED